jgi:hypothetical protein
VFGECVLIPHFGFGPPLFTRARRAPILRPASDRRSDEGEEGFAVDDERSKFYEIVGRALVDADFRARILDDNGRADALRSMGVTDPKTHDALKQAIDAVGGLEEVLGSGGKVMAS